MRELDLGANMEGSTNEALGALDVLIILYKTQSCTARTIRTQSSTT